MANFFVGGLDFLFPFPFVSVSEREYYPCGPKMYIGLHVGPMYFVILFAKQLKAEQK